MKKWWLLGIITVLAIFFRVKGVAHNPPAFYWDEMAILVDVKALLATGHDMHGRPWNQVLYPSYGDYKQPVYIWLTAIAGLVFGLHDWIVRVPNVIAGIGSLCVIWQVAKELRLKKLPQLPIASFAVMAFAPWAIYFSRSGFESFTGQFFLGLAVLALLRSKNQRWQRSVLWMMLATLLASFATYSYFSVRFVWPGLVVLWLGYLYWPKTLWWRTLVKPLVFGVVMLLSYFVLLQPMFRADFYQVSNTFRLSTPSLLNRYDFGKESIDYRAASSNQIWDRIFFHRHLLFVRQLSINLTQNMDLDFLFLTGDPLLRHGTGRHGLFLLPMIVPFVLGWWWLAHHNWKLGVVFSGWWLLAILPASIPLELPHALRSLNALLPLSLVIGIGLANMAQRLDKKVFIGFLTLWFLAICQFWYEYQVVYPVRSATAWQAEYVDQYQAIMNGQVAVTDPSLPDDGRFYLWFLWYEPFSGSEFRTWQSKDFKFDLAEVVSKARALHNE